MKNKGLVALLDGLMAYTIAFLAIGMITLLMVNTHKLDTDTSYLLNVWAEDIADAIGPSLIPPGVTDRHNDWRYVIDPRLNDNVSKSLSSISAAYGLVIDADIYLTKQGEEVIGHSDIANVGGDINTANQSAMAMRLLIPTNLSDQTKIWPNYGNNNITGILIVKVGKK